MWQVDPVNLKPSMQELAGKPVFVRLKRGLDIGGFMVSRFLTLFWLLCDMLLAITEEFRVGQSMGTLGEVFIW
ncbi:hypothetical protein F5141DRAFT_1007281 [Pisolithus sp. B1]|nr:hypothetical protein F5141DRAFT_1007281 [Pisolithus sp. B1]